MRLIDADALGIGLCNPDVFPYGSKSYAEGWNQAIKLLQNAPTVDAVEVVRCKDCKLHGKCMVEDVFTFARMEKPFCCAGARK